METFAGVQFKKNGPIHYCTKGKLNLKQNLTVIVKTKQGIEFGTVINPHITSEKVLKEENNIIRISTKKDYLKHKKNQKDSLIALKKCRELVNKNKLNMNIIEANYTFDRDKIIFKFVADSRIDFRELAKSLASIYKVRIELRQIGIRDKAKEIGGYGPCGQKLCCARFLKDLNAVSINQAKNQNIALNPSKINGVCGRLMCCLKYEDECYQTCRKGMKKIGDTIKTEQGEGTIIGLDILRQKYKVNVKDYGIVEIDKK